MNGDGPNDENHVGGAHIEYGEASSLMACRSDRFFHPPISKPKNKPYVRGVPSLMPPPLGRLTRLDVVPMPVLLRTAVLRRFKKCFKNQMKTIRFGWSR